MTARVELVQGARGEVRVETGVGRVVGLKPSGAESPYVELTLRAPPLADPVTGWADRRVDPFCRLFGDGLGAFATGSVDVDFDYRVEVHRKLGINPAAPLEKLAPTAKRRRLVWLAPHTTTAAAAHPAVPATVEPDWTAPGDPIGETLRAGFAHLPGPAAPTSPLTGDARPVPAPPDWVPFDALIDGGRYQLEAHAARLGDAAPMWQDQLAANIRDWLIEAAVDLADEHELRAVFAGIALVEHAARGIPYGHLTQSSVIQALCGLMLNMPAGSKAAAA